MVNVNIIRNVSDTYYRYKMPALVAKVEGKGNGIKTVVPNMSEIGKALDRPPQYVTKFFGNELGAQVICDNKTNRFIVNGSHDAEKLQTLLDAFITKFVLCPACKNPETLLVVDRSNVHRACKACGGTSSVDMKHRLVTYILKNPPAPIGSSKSIDPRIAQTLTDAHPLSDAGLESSTSMHSSATEVAYNDLDTFIQNALFENGQRRAIDPDALLQAIDQLGIDDSTASAIFIQSAFDSSKPNNVVDHLMQQIPALQALVKDDVQPMRAVLGGFERLFGISNVALEPQLLTIFMKLHEHDIVTEDEFLYWEKHRSKKYVYSKTAKHIRSVATPFLQWLKEAETESSSDEIANL
jgi:translation initiation factor 5